MRYELDAAGLELIRSFEGYVDGVYHDSRGFATCGVGHLIRRGPATAADHHKYDRRGWGFYSQLLLADAERVAMGPMRSYIHVPLNQNQVNALASLAFNWGGGILGGHIGELLNAKRYKAAGDYFPALAQPPILLPRRLQEQVIFRKESRAPKFPWLTVDERRWVLEYDKLLAAHRDVGRRRVLRRYMHAKAGDIVYAAHHDGGWEKSHRRQRYHSLAARSA